MVMHYYIINYLMIIWVIRGGWLEGSLIGPLNIMMKIKDNVTKFMMRDG